MPTETLDLPQKLLRDPWRRDAATTVSVFARSRCHSCRSRPITGPNLTQSRGTWGSSEEGKARLQPVSCALSILTKCCSVTKCLSLLCYWDYTHTGYLLPPNTHPSKWRYCTEFQFTIPGTTIGLRCLRGYWVGHSKAHFSLDEGSACVFRRPWLLKLLSLIHISEPTRHS